MESKFHGKAPPTCEFVPESLSARETPVKTVCPAGSVSGTGDIDRIFITMNMIIMTVIILMVIL